MTTFYVTFDGRFVRAGSGSGLSISDVLDDIVVDDYPRYDCKHSFVPSDDSEPTRCSKCGVSFLEWHRSRA